MSFAHVPIWGFSGWTTSNREVKISHCRRIVKEASIGRVVAMWRNLGELVKRRDFEAMGENVIENICMIDM